MNITIQNLKEFLITFKSKNTLIKQKEILHRVWTCINSFPSDSVPTKEDINREIVKQLTIKAK